MRRPLAESRAAPRRRRDADRFDYPAAVPITTTVLPSGLVLLVEPTPGARSAALAWLLPAGSACYSEADDGAATLLTELMLRGAGGLDARAHSEALDRIGVSRSLHVTTHHVHLGATLLGSRLDEALPPLVAMVVAPMLPVDGLEPARSLALQSLEGLEDDPQERVMLRLKELHQPSPFNRHGYGRREALEGATIETVRSAWRSRMRPKGSILGVAGDVDPGRVLALVEKLLSQWSGVAEEPRQSAPALRGATHIEEPTSQTHLALAWNAPREQDATAMRERLLVRVLGSGSSSRLFTEVREKRGLCYSVSASYSSGRDSGMLSIYAGSTPQRAQQTLDVIADQVASMRGGVTADEYRRAVVGLKSGLVMSGESTSSRAGSIAADYFRIGRARTLEEIAAEVDAVSHDSLQRYAADRSFEAPTQVAIGPQPVVWSGTAR